MFTKAQTVIGRGMDFPDVSLVLQVGLPLDADCYTHRVGRTARAGKDGRAIILLTQAESFYLKANRQFPIEEYPLAGNISSDNSAAGEVTKVLQVIDPQTKQKAYSAYLGFMKGFMNKLQMKPADLVKAANEFALYGMLSGEVPGLERKTIGKMGLKGVPGLNIAATFKNDSPNLKRGAPKLEHTLDDKLPSRRLRHQGTPAYANAASNAGAAPSWTMNANGSRVGNQGSNVPRSIANAMGKANMHTKEGKKGKPKANMKSGERETDHA